MRILKPLAIAALVFMNSVPAHAVSLKHHNTINTHTITVADVFDGAGDKGKRVLGAAPMPGKDMVLNARTLMRIALALDLNWRPQSSSETATLTRAATIISHSDIEEKIQSALMNTGITGDYTLSFETSFDQIALPDGTAKTVDITNMDFSPSTNRFKATLYAPSQNNPIHTETIIGAIERLTDIPVLTNTIRTGTLIGARDIDMIQVRESEMSGNTILDPQTLIGMTPRRTITQGSPIQVSDILKPEAVTRGSLVTMIFDSGAMRLTAEGKALQNGAAGDTIRVLNTASNKTLQAMVTDNGDVIVKTF